MTVVVFSSDFCGVISCFFLDRAEMLPTVSHYDYCYYYYYYRYYYTSSLTVVSRTTLVIWYQNANPFWVLLLEKIIEVAGLGVVLKY